ncbi:MAG: hypothetical protein LBH84_01590, partial [Prevotellaceae bacterium]|nr:hypothetical protein [Prevotellaceae bacterium]
MKSKNAQSTMRAIAACIGKSIYARLLCNFALMLLLFMACRLLFYLFNREFFPDMSAHQIRPVFVGGLRFDVSALAWGNIAYIALFIIPFKFRYSDVYQSCLKALFVTVNTILLAANCADVIYFKFTLRRTTADFFQEFASGDNFESLLGHFIVDFWYMWLIWIALVA